MSDYPIANDVNDLYVYKTMSFHVNTTNVRIAIELCDEDPINDDLADISCMQEMVKMIVVILYHFIFMVDVPFGESGI